MKQLILASALGTAALMGISAQAATATGNFDVTINLTSACKVSTAPTAAFTYTSFQATAATFSSSFNIMCTKTLPISSIALDSSERDRRRDRPGLHVDHGRGPAAGTGVAQSVTLTGSMAANQAGKCATATCANTAATNKQRTITITY